LSLGVGVSAVYASTRQRIFPNTSVFDGADPAHSFFGSELKGAHALRYGLRLGVQYTPTKDLSFGAVFANRVALPLRGGRLDANLTSLDLGTVTYHDVRIDGLALPREVSMGAAWQVDSSTLLSLKLSRLYWSGALATLTLGAGNPDNSLAPAEIRNVATLNWHDRTVVALGVRHALDERTALLAGFNFGRRPMADETLSPLFAPIGQKHLTFGLARRLDREYEVSGGIEYLFPERIRYTNPELPGSRSPAPTKAHRNRCSITSPPRSSARRARRCKVSCSRPRCCRASPPSWRGRCPATRMPGNG
jgi:long-chain fatty acid transport protein